MSYKLRSALIVILLACVCACENNSEIKVVVLGDSISTGYQLSEPWPNKLAEQPGLIVDNSFSVDGIATTQAIETLQRLIALNDPPDYLIIMLGTNDAIFGSAEIAIKNLQMMVSLADANEIKVILATLPTIERSRAYDRAAEEISVAIRDMHIAEIVDVRSAYSGVSDLLADGIHPNAKGQQLIAESMAAALSAVIAKRN